MSEISRLWCCLSVSFRAALADDVQVGSGKLTLPSLILRRGRTTKPGCFSCTARKDGVKVIVNAVNAKEMVDMTANTTASKTPERKPV
jgi:hypothetical protein